MSEVEADVVRVASAITALLDGHPAGAVDYSPESLRVIEAALEEAGPYWTELPEGELNTLVQQFGCYVLEVARRQFGGEYRWLAEIGQPVLVLGEPARHIAIATWAKVRRRLEDPADSITFFYEGVTERMASAPPGYRALLA